MNLTHADYQNLLYARLERMRTQIYPQDRPQPAGGFGIAVGGNAYNAFDVARAPVPDFDGIKTTLKEMLDLTEEFETSIGPA